MSNISSGNLAPLNPTLPNQVTPTPNAPNVNTATTPTVGPGSFAVGQTVPGLSSDNLAMAGFFAGMSKASLLSADEVDALIRQWYANSGDAAADAKEQEALNEGYRAQSAYSSLLAKIAGFAGETAAVTAARTARDAIQTQINTLVAAGTSEDNPTLRALRTQLVAANATLDAALASQNSYYSSILDAVAAIVGFAALLRMFAGPDPSDINSLVAKDVVEKIKSLDKNEQKYDPLGEQDQARQVEDQRQNDQQRQDQVQRFFNSLTSVQRQALQGVVIAGLIQNALSTTSSTLKPLGDKQKSNSVAGVSAGSLAG